MRNDILTLRKKLRCFLTVFLKYINNSFERRFNIFNEVIINTSFVFIKRVKKAIKALRR